MRYDLATDIAAVTVYPDRALVVRVGTVEITEPGEHLLHVGGLPLGINRDSLRAIGRGPAGTRILGVEQAAEYHSAAPEDERRALEDEIRRLERELALLDDRRQIYDEQRDWLRSLAEHSARSFAWGLTHGSVKPEDASVLFTYAAEEAQRTATTRQQIERERDETARLLEARRREYAQLGMGRLPDRTAAAIRVTTEASGRVQMELAYLISGATWRPRYDIRVDAERGSIHLTQQALINQRTGEDWVRVPLALSTARPAAAQRLPDEPDPWYIDTVEPMPQIASAVAMPMAVGATGPLRAAARSRATFASPQAEAFAASAPPGEFEEAMLASADMERTGSVQVFHIAGSGDVPSDGAPHLFSLGEHDLPCQIDYVAMPEVAEGAQRRARGRNLTGQVLLPGSLHIFTTGTAGDEYIGSTTLDLTAENAELTLYLGIDDNITVKRELVERDTDKGSLLQSGIRRITLGYRVTLGNRTDTVRRVVLKDRLPVPRHERIKLKVLDLKPQPTERTRLEQLTWELDVPPDEERRVEWRFVIEAPAELQLTGLP